VLVAKEDVVLGEGVKVFVEGDGLRSGVGVDEGLGGCVLYKKQECY
jgi:hypothetical protein